MDRLIFILALVLLAGIISLITGRNRRQIKRIPPGMAILCQPPGKRYMLYALGVMVLGVAGRVNGRIVWKKLRVYTADIVYKFNVGYLTYGKDDFIAELRKMTERYEIPRITEKK